jgi:hypothetical protein
MTTLIRIHRQCSCAHFSALIVLLANILLSPAHDSTCLDFQIVTNSIRLFEQIVDVIESPAYEPLQRIIGDLYKSATEIVSKVQLEQLDGLNKTDVFSPANCTQEGDVGIFAEGMAFPEFEWDNNELSGLGFDTLFDPSIDQ